MKLTSKKMKVNQIKTGVVLSYLQMGLGMVISLVYTPLMLRMLGQSEYGLYNISASVVSYLNILQFGFGSSYVRYYIKYKRKEQYSKIKALNALFLTVFSVLGIIALIAGFCLAFNCSIIFGDGLTSDELAIVKILMMIMSVNMAISFPASVFVSFITANEKFVVQKLVNMLKTVFSPAITLLVLVMDHRAIGMSLAVTFVTMITEVINVIYCLKVLKMKFCFRHMEKRLLIEIAGFSSFIALNMIVDEINWNVDKFLLGRFRGSIATSVYAVASTLNTYYRNISTSITNVFTPRIHTIANGENANHNLDIIFAKIGRIQFMLLGMIFTGFIFFGKRFVLFWAGKDYFDAYYIALLLMGPVTIPLIQGLGIEIQRSKNMHRFRSVAYVFMSIMNVAMSIPLCIKFGGIGCALGTAISVVFANGFLMNWYYNNKMGLNINYFWKQIIKLVPGMIVPILFGVVVSRYAYTCNLILYFTLIFLYSTIYFVSCWRLCMNSYEKQLLQPILSKLLRKN